MAHLRQLTRGVRLASLLFILSVCNARAADTTAMNFGAIELHPGGDTITIAAENGPTSASSIRSYVSPDSRSGAITLQASEGNDEHVDIAYPDEVHLTCGSHQLTVSNIPSHSQYATTTLLLPGNGSSIDVSVGGELTLQGDETPCNYSGPLLITLHYL